MKTLTFKVPEALAARVTTLAKKRHVTRSAIVREALERYAQASTATFEDVAGDLFGSVEGPSDLSSSADYLKDFGR